MPRQPPRAAPAVKIIKTRFHNISVSAIFSGMLTLLRVRNLALVENASVAFGPGLNIISGETGAGKSVLIGALYLLLGERADTSLIRSGADQCMVEGAFQLARPERVNAILEESGLDPCEDGLLILRRIIKPGGGSQAFINDVPSTAALLKRLGAGLVDLHGPHDHQALFQPAEQLAMLDTYATSTAERQAYSDVYTRWQLLHAQLKELEMDADDLDAQIDLLSWRVKEIEEAGLSEDEEPAVREELETAGHAGRILELGQHIIQACSEGDTSALAILAPARKAMDELARLYPAAEAWAEEWRTHTDALASLSIAIQHDLSRIDADPARLDWLDRRLAVYANLKKKYGPTLADVFHTLETATERLQTLRNHGAKKQDLAKNIQAAEKDLRRLGLQLGKKRQAAAKKLAPAIMEELRAIGFEHGRFDISFAESEQPLPSGLDKIEFAFAPNIGEPMRPLRAIASSGEISRVMLAIKVVLADADPVELMVFDEIDANVGGQTAQAVGYKLRQAAQGRQIIAITHLPTVAACGDAHSAVRKHVVDGRTQTQVLPLDEQERIE